MSVALARASELAPRRLRRAAGVAAVALALLAPREAPAATQLSVEGGALVTEFDSVALAGLRLTTGAHRGAGFDGALFAATDLSNVLLDLDAAYPLPLGSAFDLAFRGGLSGLVQSGDDVFSFRPGGNVGLGLVARPSERLFVRVDGTWHGFSSPKGTIYGVSAGIGWVLGTPHVDENGKKDYPGTGRLEK